MVMIQDLRKMKGEVRIDEAAEKRRCRIGNKSGQFCERKLPVWEDVKNHENNHDAQYWPRDESFSKNMIVDGLPHLRGKSTQQGVHNSSQTSIVLPLSSPTQLGQNSGVKIEAGKHVTSRDTATKYREHNPVHPRKENNYVPV